MERTHDNIDHSLSIETIILEGLAVAVYKGWITEDEKSAWLNEYIEKRNAEDMLYIGIDPYDTGKD